MEDTRISMRAWGTTLSGNWECSNVVLIGLPRKSGIATTERLIIYYVRNRGWLLAYTLAHCCMEILFVLQWTDIVNG